MATIKNNNNANTMSQSQNIELVKLLPDADASVLVGGCKRGDNGWSPPLTEEGPCYSNVFTL
ncbi:MAG: hypothetical protein AAFW84_04070 [Cyanobacteria bacterium J06635_15]